ncbi:GNAT family N-acetyltransferase [Salimicrobium flavidum]|uniref:Protein N-acetyltransferase, RimJ/RimL family n=1 Tax=Salimicrobium flavidum TaxID=570947 RepID=A0A1N7JZD4_9BACI|nr:GNAT family N-acetyltransferase [Salimicrobium flavidum]SIS54678.1 Protein N-acetyltransferase, RimJ/RimL family [Salimicrobium flavidum]
MHLETKRLLLRPYNMEDATDVSALADDEEIARRTFVPHPYTVEDAESWISTHAEFLEEGSAYPLAMIEKESGRLTGTMTLRVNTKHRNGELAYWVGQPFWGRGYASEAAQCVTDFGFDSLELERIWGRALSDNEASQKVMTKTGLLYEGVLRHEVFHDGEFKDTYMYGMIRADR